MAATEALKTAIELLHVPSRVRGLLTAPLPNGVGELLAIASGDKDSLAKAASQSGRAESVVYEAAKFYIEQILLAPQPDSYRVLGATPQTSPADLRRNMANLVKWLHPDAGQLADRPAFTGRVNKAWDDLKTPERRAAYDAMHEGQSRSDEQRPTKKRRLNRKKHVTPNPLHAHGGPRGQPAASSRLRRALLVLLGRGDV